MRHEGIYLLGDEGHDRVRKRKRLLEDIKQHRRNIIRRITPSRRKPVGRLAGRRIFV